VRTERKLVARRCCVGSGLLWNECNRDQISGKAVIRACRIAMGLVPEHSPHLKR
jgi:hypothetical protein